MTDDGEDRTTLDGAPDFLNPGEIAEILRIGRNQAYTMIRQGELPGARRCRGAWRIPKAAIFEYFGLERPSAPDGGTGAIGGAAASGAGDRGGS